MTGRGWTRIEGMGGFPPGGTHAGHGGGTGTAGFSVPVRLRNRDSGGTAGRGQRTHETNDENLWIK